MKRTRATRYVGVDAHSAAELGELLTQKCEELKEFNPTVVKWAFELGYSALLCYEEHIEIPETLRDEYELRGEGYTCGDCPFKVPVTDGRARHRWTCKRMPQGTDVDIRACNWFYTMLEKGEVYK